jgi:opacity protein-like surface antigen
MKLKIMFLSLAAWIVLAAMPRVASSEWFVDAYIGPAFTHDGRFAGLRTDYDTAFSGGGRIGYYLGFFPFVGLAVDGSAYAPDGELANTFNFDAKVAALSFDAFLRLPLFTSQTFPHGQLQPYVFAGPGIYFTKVKSLGSSDRDHSVGGNVGAGLNWMFLPNVGVMTEYRYSGTRPEFFGERTRIRTHRLLAGVTLHF